MVVKQDVIMKYEREDISFKIHFLRFLVKADYNLESGGDYMFTIRAKF